MELKSFQVHNFRNIVDSGEVEVDENVTCLVGKNEAGKSALLEALYLLNPIYEDDSFDANDQYPRWHRKPRTDCGAESPVPPRLATDHLAQLLRRNGFIGRRQAECFGGVAGLPPLAKVKGSLSNGCV